MDLNKFATSTPINKLASIVTSGGSELPETPPFAELCQERVWFEARHMRRETGKKLPECRDIITRKAGYDGWEHYVSVLKSRGEFKNSADRRAKIKAQRAARYQAEVHAGLRPRGWE